MADNIDFDKRYKNVADEAKQKYEQIYRRMIDKLCEKQFEPFAEILREKEGIEFDAAIAVESLKENLLQEFLTTWENDVWESSAANGIAGLEMLKEHFKEYEGTDWHINDMTPEERILPLRIRYKEMRLRWLTKQINHQNALVQKMMEDATKRRQFVQGISDEAVLLTEQIEKCKDNIKDQKKKLSQDFPDLLAYPENGFKTIAKVREEFD